MNILVVGGSRFVGPLLVQALALRKHNLTVFNRGTREITWPEGVRVVSGDRTQGFSLRETFEVIVDTCAYKPEHIERLFTDVDCDYYLHVGTAASYKKTHLFPLTEESALGEWPLWGEYNLGKLACENLLQKSQKPYGVIRPVYILGKNNHVPRESFIYSALRRGETIRIPGDGSAIIQFVFADIVASSVVALAEARAEGAFNCCGNEAITLRGLVKEMATIAGVKPVIEFNPRMNGIEHDAQEFPFANEHCFCSNEKIKKLGISFPPLLDNLSRDYHEYYENVTRP